MTAELHDDFVRVAIGDTRADFHLRWLRHNCDLDRHAQTGERTIDSAALPDTLAVAELVVEDAVLRVRWTHDHRVSRYPLAWLREHAYAVDRATVPPPPSDTAGLEIDGRYGSSAVIEDLIARVAVRGAAIVRRDSAAPEHETEAWIAAIEELGLRSVATHFGRIEDLRTDNTTNANTDQLGYTDAAIELHTDQPFLDAPPRYQLLQSIRRADSGGETTVADGLAAFRYFESIDAELAARLLATPVHFHRKQKAFEASVVAPIVSFAGGTFTVRSSYFTVAPYRVPFADMAAWYRAHDRFTRIVRDPRFHYRFTLAPGDVLLYDNHRMLHGRTAFVGPRWVRGVYFDAGPDAGFLTSG
jgi:alpha-ketoglutarate-dependent taurine dioxygenase